MKIKTTRRIKLFEMVNNKKWVAVEDIKEELRSLDFKKPRLSIYNEVDKIIQKLDGDERKWKLNKHGK